MGWAIRNEKDHKIVGWIPILSKVNNWRNVGLERLCFCGTLPYIILSGYNSLARQVSMEEPQDYSDKTMKAIVKKYTELAEEINAERAGQLTDQTVIYVLSESFADPRRVPGVTISQNVIPNIEYYESTTSGLMKS